MMFLSFNYTFSKGLRERESNITFSDDLFIDNPKFSPRNLKTKLDITSFHIIPSPQPHSPYLLEEDSENISLMAGEEIVLKVQVLLSIECHFYRASVNVCVSVVCRSKMYLFYQ